MSPFPPKPDHSKELPVHMGGYNDWYLTRGDSPIFDRLFGGWFLRDTLIWTSLFGGRMPTLEQIERADAATRGLHSFTSAERTSS